MVDGESARDSGGMLLTVPNMLSIFRLCIVPLQLFFAWSGRAGCFLAFLVAALMSDCLDGVIARKLNQDSALGARLDSWGDLATYLSLPICAWWLWPGILRREALFVIMMLAGYVVPVSVGALKFRRLPSYHTWGAKMSAVLMGISVVFLFAGWSSWPFRISSPIVLLAGLENVAITAILSRWRANVPSLYHAMKLVGAGKAELTTDGRGTVKSPYEK